MRRLLVVLLLLAGGLAAGPRTITIGGKKIRIGPAVNPMQGVIVFNLRFRKAQVIGGEKCTVVSGTMMTHLRAPLKTVTVRIRLMLEYADALYLADCGTITATVHEPKPGKAVKFYAKGPAWEVLTEGDVAEPTALYCVESITLNPRPQTYSRFTRKKR